ncbi:hypothetical protein GCK72_020815 [Caenorhabditis remanei]|uniref:Uncharacterized protein n=1 Tax=Caenorhabditis remanei TaxID=31234 RepID=A0A6A5GI73_CAERE|nr:hypothetical protein GCK72_020815 [Caenorhabditis remanei]KAF1754255.1 hypothetical protein GCK72_020815 [Caenorhabditis remanei]
MLEFDQIDLPSSSNTPSSTPSPALTEFTSSPGGKSKSLRKSGKPYQFVPSACQVCYGKATGHHYDVASCNGCKSFFRRVTIEKLQYKCSVGMKCYEDFKPGDQIPKCRACRYKRCVETGMNPLGIQSELRKMSESSSMEETGSGKEIVVLPRIVEPPKSIEAQVADLIKHLVHLDLKTNAFRDCSYNPVDFPTLKEAIKEDVSIIGFGDRFGPMPGWPLSPETIEEARKPNPIPGTRKVLPPNVKRWVMYDLLTIVEMAKTFDFFTKLSENDRYYLCRDTTLMVSNLTRAFFCVENKTDQLIRSDGQTTMATPPKWLPKEYMDKLIFDIMKRAIKTLIRMKCTKIEFLLLRAILLCNAAAPDISNSARTILSTERAKYTVALLNYTMANHGPEGPGRFAEILNVIDVLERQQKDQRDVNVYICLYRPKHVKLPLLDDVMMIC